MREWIFFLLLIVIVAACKSESDLNLTYDRSASFAVPTTVFIAIPSVLDTIYVDHEIDSVLSANGRSFTDVKRVEMTSMSLLANDSTGADIGFLSTIDFSIGVGDSLGMLVATSGDLLATDSVSFPMQVTTRDLSEFFTSDAFWLLPDVVTDQTVLQETSIEMQMEFLVETD